MSEQPRISAVTRDEFPGRVLERSRERPVLVDFWAAWCQPCHMLAPILEQLAAEYEGRLDVVKVDTDREAEIAVRYGIRSLPTVTLFVNGEVAVEFSGVQPPARIKALLEPHIPRASDDLRLRAEGLRAVGRTDEALRLLEEAHRADPQNFRIHRELVVLLIDVGRLNDAELLIKSLPPNVEVDDEFTVLQARLGFARVAAGAPDRASLNKAVDSNPDDLEARYRLSAVDVIEGEYEEAMENLLEIIRRDRGYRDDGGRRALIDVFAILNNEGPLVRRYRSLLSSALN